MTLLNTTFMILHPGDLGLQGLLIMLPMFFVLIVVPVFLVGFIIYKVFSRK